MTMPRKVLVVENHGGLLEFLARALTLSGWDTLTADSGREALIKLAHDSPSVILLDMRMPVMNGFELAGILKAHPVYKNIPILAASGSTSEQTREPCLAAGCDDFIAKPFAISTLEMRLTQLASAGRQKTTSATAIRS
ncbi:MAG TPA: response regulator [Methylomirabilota bacterium]|nr:response regulator [Methylomirabilota bacterium]